MGKLLFDLCWMYWTALVHASHILWATWWTLVWLCVTGPVILGIHPDNPSSPGGVLYSESSDSDFMSSPLGGGTTCISKFQWTTWVLPTPCKGLMVYMWRFGCCSSTTYFVFSQHPLSCVFILMLSAKLDRGHQAWAWRISFSGHTIASGR